MNGGARRAPLPSLLPGSERERERERGSGLERGGISSGFGSDSGPFIPEPNGWPPVINQRERERERRAVVGSDSTTAVTTTITLRRRHHHHHHHHPVRSEKAIAPTRSGYEQILLLHLLQGEQHQVILFPSSSQVDEDDDGHSCWSHPQRGHGSPSWPLSFSDVIYHHHSAQCFTNAMVGPRSWLGGLFFRYGNRRNGDKTADFTLTPLQEQRLQRLKDRLNVPFDETRPDHQEALRALWNSSFPETDLTGLISEQWKDMGWQGPNPSTDFRGCGFVSLENLLFFVRTYPASFQRILFKRDGMRAAWEYPFAVAGINVSFMLIQMLDLYSEKPKTLAGVNFVRVLSEDEEAFDVLYCIAFQMVDAQWLAMRASYLQFNEVLQATRIQLERELALEDVNRIQDLPAYNLLYK